MGTRSLTFVYDETGEPMVNMYRQFDGYPTGHGAELAEFLLSGRMVNGLTGMGKEKQFNGMGCLSAKMISHFKQGPGGIYIYPVTTNDCWQDYEYHVYKDCVRVYNYEHKGIFDGSWENFKKFCSGDYEGKTDYNAPFNTPSGQDWLKSILNDGVATVTFTKSDGTERVMKCTLDRKLVPNYDERGEVKRIIEQIRTVSPDVLPVYDVEAQGWRSFRWDSIKDVTISLVKE
jgi:hypothetical protein